MYYFNFRILSLQNSIFAFLKITKILQSKLIYIIGIIFFSLFSKIANAQYDQNNPDNLFNVADSLNKRDSLKSDWIDEQAKIYYTQLSSNLKHDLDTTIGKFHRFQPTQPWWGVHLGNYGTAAQNLYFNPKQDIGLRLGYDIYDLYAFNLDSVNFYNTTRPYSAFSFILGSTEQQSVDFLHTQNIRTNWNFAGRIRYQSAEGFFAQQKATNISGSFTTDYKSTNERYQAKAVLLYNKFSQDENGGIVSDSLLSKANYNDRRRIPVNFPLRNNNRSAVTNSLKTFDFFLQNNYSWGKADTLYNEDSTKATYQFTPRFRLQHELLIHSEKHIFLDKDPDSLRYDFIKPITFNYGDSVLGLQSWYYVDNKFSLNGFIGQNEHLAQLKVGIANRIDHLSQNSTIDRINNTYVSNYLFGQIKKEALAEKQWAYQAQANFFFSGKALGDFSLKAVAGKDFGKYGFLSAGLHQSLGDPPLSFQNFKTNFYEIASSLDKISISKIFANVLINRINLELNLDNTIVTNYIYFTGDGNIQQYSTPFNVTQLSARKKFSYRSLSLDNEIVWQQATLNAPLHLPSLMFREQIKLETFLFKNALKIAVGLEGRYSTNYKADGYTPYFNQFYLQDNYEFNNLPEVAFFFNFKVKSFRAFVLLDQLQELISKNNMNAVAFYPAPDFNFRFGFTWVLVN